jgi:prepilin-type processing-associated H-X9-DG protein
MPYPMVSVPPINGGNNYAETIDQQLLPYSKNDQIWACPDDSSPFTDGGSVPPFWNGKYNGAAGGTYRHRTYTYVASIYTREANALDPNTGLAQWDDYFPSSGSIPHALAAFDAPADTISLVESSNTARSADMGSPYGAIFCDCDAWKLAGRTPGTGGSNVASACSSSFSATTNVPYQGHVGRGNYAFADGHAKSLPWGTVLHDDFALFKLKKTTTVFTP